MGFVITVIVALLPIGYVEYNKETKRTAFIERLNAAPKHHVAGEVVKIHERKYGGVEALELAHAGRSYLVYPGITWIPDLTGIQSVGFTVAKLEGKLYYTGQERDERSTPLPPD